MIMLRFLIVFNDSEFDYSNYGIMIKEFIDDDGENGNDRCYFARHRVGKLSGPWTLL
jgi:hypothetical protein